MNHIIILLLLFIEFWTFASDRWPPRVCGYHRHRIIFRNKETAHLHTTLKSLVFAIQFRKVKNAFCIIHVFYTFTVTYMYVRRYSFHHLYECFLHKSKSVCLEIINNREELPMIIVAPNSSALVERPNESTFAFTLTPHSCRKWWQAVGTKRVWIFCWHLRCFIVLILNTRFVTNVGINLDKEV